MNEVDFFSFSILESKSPPSANSITMHKVPVACSKKASLYDAMFSWLTEAKILTSLMALSFSFYESLFSLTLTPKICILQNDLLS
jgi:hypothetical protein